MSPHDFDDEVVKVWWTISVAAMKGDYIRLPWPHIDRSIVETIEH